jgi:hypothetical protein
MEGRENPDMDRMGGSAQGPSHFSLEDRNPLESSSNDRFWIARYSSLPNRSHHGPTRTTTTPPSPTVTAC